MRHDTSFNRRGFLKQASVLAATPCIVSAAALGGAGKPPPSDRITLGFIGVGMMGQGHHRRFLKHSGVQVLAVCDVDTWRRDNAQRLTEKTYGAARPSGGYSGCEAYNDLRDLLARDDIDAVVIATGDRWHGVASVLAAEAGKDIYCEKPMSLTIYQARAMVDAVRRYGRVFQTGLQQRSAREFRLACNLARDGAIGKVHDVYVHFPGTSSEVDLPAESVPEGLDWNLWLGPAPWRPYNSQFHIYGKPPRVVPWHFCRDFGGGNLTSNAVHAFDVVQWALGADGTGPVEIIPPETGDVADLTYQYANGATLRVINGKLDPNRHDIPEGWDPVTSLQAFGALYVGEQGWIHVGRRGYLTSYPKEIVTDYPERYDHAVAVNDHHQNWLNAIRTRRRPAADVAIGCQSTIVSHLGCIAHWTGRAQRWSPENEEFVNDDEANRLRRRAMREPWRV
ncbi:MAG: Gfo/Idh/MocA family protein [Planctomycetota bacterium]